MAAAENKLYSMNQQKLPALLALFFCLFFSYTSLLGQTDRREEHPEHPERSEKKLSPFFSRLWYGGGVSLGFTGNSGVSQFGFGISPMVGYKIYGPFSAGPRVSITYSSFKVRGYKALNVFDKEAGLFLRAKVFRGFFLQGELSHEWGNDIGITFNGDLVKIKNEFDNQYLGAGYNFGDGQVGSEIGIFYNLNAANDINSNRDPWEYRFGFTWKF